MHAMRQIQWQQWKQFIAMVACAPFTCAYGCRPPLTTCSTPQTRKEMAGSRGYAAATPGVPLWSPLAPLLPPNELRLLDSTSSDLGLDLPLVTASSAEIALAEEAGPEDSMAAAAAAAGDSLPALAGVPTPSTAPAETVGSGVAASDVLGDAVAPGDRPDHAVERAASRFSSAHQPAHTTIANEESSAQNAPCSGLAEGLTHVCGGDRLGKSTRNEMQILGGPTPCPGQISNTVDPPDDVTAELPKAEIRVATGGCPDLSVGTVVDPSEASDHSAVQLLDDSETPRSSCTAAPAAQMPAGCSEDAAPFPEGRAAGAEQGLNRSHSLLQHEHVHEDPALADVQEVPLQLHNADASALDLARNARSIASKAAAAPLSVDHPLVRQAAMELSRRAAIEKATLQVHPSRALTY